MPETELGKLIVVSPSMPSLTSISSGSVDRVSNSLTSSVSQTQGTFQEKNNSTENRFQMMERNISNLGETLNRFIEAQRTSREQVRMKVGTRQGHHQLGKRTKALTDQGHPIDNITFITFITSAREAGQGSWLKF